MGRIAFVQSGSRPRLAVVLEDDPVACSFVSTWGYADCTVLALRGELDISDRAELSSRLADVASCGPWVIVDLTNLACIDCDSLDVLAGARDRAQRAGGDAAGRAARSGGPSATDGPGRGVFGVSQCRRGGVQRRARGDRYQAGDGRRRGIPGRCDRGNGHGGGHCHGALDLRRQRVPRPESVVARCFQHRVLRTAERRRARAVRTAGLTARRASIVA